MCKALEDFGRKIAEEVTEEITKKVTIEQQEKTISALLKKGMSVEWIHDTLDFSVEMIEKF